MTTTPLATRLKMAMAGPPAVRPVDLARVCNVKPPSVAGWLSGKTKRLQDVHVLALADYLGVDPWWLASGQGPMRPMSQRRNTRPSDAWPFTSTRTEFQQLQPSERQALDVIVTAFITSHVKRRR